MKLKYLVLLVVGFVGKQSFAAENKQEMDHLLGNNKSLILYNDCGDDITLQVRLPLTANPNSRDEYIAFKPVGSFTFAEWQQQFTLPKGHAIKIPYLLEFFDKFSEFEQASPTETRKRTFRISGDIKPFIIRENWFIDGSPKVVGICKDFRSSGAGVLDIEKRFKKLSDLEINTENIHELDLLQVLWIKKAQKEQTSLKNISDAVIKSNEYPKK